MRAKVSTMYRDYQHILDAVDAPLLVTDDSGTITYANAPAEQLLGRVAGELNGSNIGAVLSARSRSDESNSGRMVLHLPNGDVAEIEVVRHGARVDGQSIDVYSLRDMRPRRAVEREGEELRQQLEFVHSVTDNLAIGVSTCDRTGRIAFINPAAGKMLGVTDEIARGQDFHALVHPDEKHAEDDCPLYRALHGNESVMVDAGEFTRADGSKLAVDYTVAPFFTGTFALGSVVSFGDITARREAEEQLRESEERYRSVVEASANAIMLLALDGTILTANQQAADLYGLPSPREMEGMNCMTFLVPEERTRARASLQHTLETGEPHLDVEYTLLRVDGSQVPIEVSTGLLRDAAGAPNALTLIATDITERKRAAETLQYMALHDSLTELPNRVLLQDRLNQAILTAQRERSSLALLFMDLDRFKEVNDTLGHHFGDLLLRQASHRIRAPLRHSDTVARLGGDEFGILLPGADEGGAIRAAGKILESITSPLILDGQAWAVGGSIGIAVYPEHGQEVTRLMQHADTAMYVAKRTRSGFALYNPMQDEVSPERSALIAELEEGIEAEQFELFYQPIVALDSSRLVAVEALLRWRHPRRGLLTPAHFLPLAEQTGLIQPLSEWALLCALEQWQAWNTHAPQLSLNLNFSARSLQFPRLPQMLQTALYRACSSPRHLIIDIAESAVMNDPDRYRGTLSDLHAIGVRLALDDMGSGHSSLAQLVRLPVDILKIDISIVRHLLDSPEDRAVVQSIVALGHALGLTVVAEGIEDRIALEQLTALGCDWAQGFAISPPIPASKLEDWVD